MKYASRHVLYPVPNVFELVVLMVAREVLEPVVRELFILVLRVVASWAERVVAARDAADDIPRVVVGRVLVVGCVPVRTLTVWAVVRETILFCLVARPAETFCIAPDREIVDASRTAASQTPMPMQHAKTTGNTFLILTIMVMLAKKIIFEQGLI